MRARAHTHTHVHAHKHMRAHTHTHTHRGCVLSLVNQTRVADASTGRRLNDLSRMDGTTVLPCILGYTHHVTCAAGVVGLDADDVDRVVERHLATMAANKSQGWPPWQRTRVRVGHHGSEQESGLATMAVNRP